jgi:hypothetical protein
VSCAPKSVPSPLIWDGADNLFFRPLSETLGVVVGAEAVDVNSMDEVPDSSWFTNRIGQHPLTPDEVTRGACAPELLLHGITVADGSWIVDKGKSGGAADGFRVNVPGKGKYMFKADEGDAPEHASAAQSVGTRVYFAAGYYTTCEQVVYFRPSVLRLVPGLRWQHNFGDDEAFDQKALDSVLAHSSRRGGLVRMVASAWLKGYPLGGFRYEGTRGDDPNDVVPHEDRRELRGKRLLDAWLDRIDDRRGNTLDMWIADRSGEPDASPGHVIHNNLDTSEALGPIWPWESVSRRLGFSYVVDWSDMAADFLSLGARERPWDTVQRRPGKSMFAYFNVEDFVPDQWKNEYAIAAFSRMTERDGAWMARILARFTPDVVRTLADAAHFTDPENTNYLEAVLEGRLGKILERYLTRLSPITEVAVEGADRVCGIDLAEWRGLRPATDFRYRSWRVEGPRLAVERRSGARVCITLPHTAPDGGVPDGAPSRYVRVRIEDGVAKAPLVVHLYDLGPSRGYFLAGLERPDP